MLESEEDAADLRINYIKHKVKRDVELDHAAWEQVQFLAVRHNTSSSCVSCVQVPQGGAGLMLCRRLAVKAAQPTGSAEVGQLRWGCCRFCSCCWLRPRWKAGRGLGLACPSGLARRLSGGTLEGEYGRHGSTPLILARPLVPWALGPWVVGPLGLGVCLTRCSQAVMGNHVCCAEELLSHSAAPDQRDARATDLETEQGRML